MTLNRRRQRLFSAPHKCDPSKDFCHNRLRPEAAVVGNYSITSSARTRNVSEIVSPIPLAVLRLTTNSNCVGCITGRSTGFSPLRTRPA